MEPFQDSHSQLMWSEGKAKLTLCILFQQEPARAPHVALIICPLKSLVRDQVSSARDAGVKAAGILPKDEMLQDDMTGRAYNYVSQSFGPTVTVLEL